MRKLICAIAAACLLTLGASAQTVQSSGKAFLSWDPIPTPNIVAVKIYYGTSAGGESASVTVTQPPPLTTLPTTGEVDNLLNGVKYFFYATVVQQQPDGSLLESLPSDEVSVTMPWPAPPAITNLKITNAVPK